MTAPTTFTCPRCQRTSHNPNDARYGCCGACHDWTAPQGVALGLPTSAPGSRRVAPPLWERVDLPDRIAPLVVEGSRMYEGWSADGAVVRVLVSHEPQGWHLSISANGRYPTWDEIADARYRFVPDRARMAMLLPPRAEWIDVHHDTFHLHEVADDTRQQTTP